MINKKNKIHSRIKRFYAIQQNSLKSYVRIKKITTDEEVITIVNSLQGNHTAFAPSLEGLLPKKKNGYFNTLSRVKSYIQAGWKGVVTSLIVNNKPKIYEYIWQSEIKILQEIQPLLQHFAEDKIQYQLLTEYEKAIYQNLDKLDLFIRKSRNQHRVAA